MPSNSRKVSSPVIMPSNSRKAIDKMNHDAQEILICDVKVAKKAWIEPGQRIDHTFEFQVQAISVDKLLCILDAVVFTTVAPRTDDDDDDNNKGLCTDDNLSHHLNDLVKGVIERETHALAASMTMAEIFRGTDSFINHQAVFRNAQLELKQLGRLIVYDAYVYVKPQFVDVSGNEDLSYIYMAEEERERQDAARQTEEVFVNVQPDQLPLLPLPQQQWEASRPKVFFLNPDK